MSKVVHLHGGPRARVIAKAPTSAHSGSGQPRTGAMDMSFEKFFADRFARFLQAHFHNPTQVAAAFNVRERTAENWWSGLNAPTGAKVAMAFTFWPREAKAHLTLTGQGKCAQSSERRSSAASSSSRPSQPEPTGSPGKRRAA